MWQYNSTIEKEIDMAGKHRVRVLIKNGGEEELVMLKFQTEPSDEEITTAINKFLEVKNAPAPEPEPTVDELKNQIAEKDALIVEQEALITEKDAQIFILTKK